MPEGFIVKMKEESIFLTTDRALDAGRLHFPQYEPQIMLACEILRPISGGDTVVRRGRQKNGAWINVTGRRNMLWMDGPELVGYVCESLMLSAPSVGNIPQVESLPS